MDFITGLPASTK
jgi:hypothetical protein